MDRIRLVLSDIDGCICSETYDLKVISQIRRYCEKAQKDPKLARFAFVTGRGSDFVECLSKMLNAFTPEDFPSIVENGAFLFKPKSRVLIPHPVALENEQLVTTIKSEVLRLVEAGIARRIRSKEVVISLLPYNSTMNTEELAKIVKRSITPEVLEKIFVTYSTTAVDITPKGVDKGSCLKFLCKVTQIPASQVLCIGDSDGDIPILKIAGIPACPNNATIKVKNIVAKRKGYIAEKCFEIGVVEILRHFD